MPEHLETELACPKGIVDYDGDSYDYSTFWRNRDYERWVEARVLARLLPRLGRPSWFADFAGGFGRKASDPSRPAWAGPGDWVGDG